MWCNMKDAECYKAYWESCLGCRYFEEAKMEFKYECPDCHGKFNEAIYKFMTSKIREIGKTNIVTETPLGHRYVCPFCERIMEGLL